MDTKIKSMIKANLLLIELVSQTKNCLKFMHTFHEFGVEYPLPPPV